jgi:hypothetical protein
MVVLTSLLLSLLQPAPQPAPAAAAGPKPVIDSAYAAKDFELTADPNSPQWAKAPRVLAGRDYFGEEVPGGATEIRSRWTSDYLYLLYICPYDELNLKPEPTTTDETPRLWNWDVAEAFIGSDAERITRYKEFQVSPQSEWVDLDIDRDDPKGQAGMKWNSGYTVKGRIVETADASGRKYWYGEMKIPFKSIDARPAEKGRNFRVGLYRIAGKESPGVTRKHYAWSPTGQKNFHVPQAFGTLTLK